MQTICTSQTKFRRAYLEDFQSRYPELILHIELWELSEDDCEELERFGSQSDLHEFCMGLYLAKYAPRESFSRKRGYHILDQVIERYFTGDTTFEVSDSFVDGILGFLRENPAAYARISHVIETWDMVTESMKSIARG